MCTPPHEFVAAVLRLERGVARGAAMAAATAAASAADAAGRWLVKCGCVVALWGSLRECADGNTPASIQALQQHVHYGRGMNRAAAPRMNAQARAAAAGSMQERSQRFAAQAFTSAAAPCRWGQMISMQHNCSQGHLEQVIEGSSKGAPRTQIRKHATNAEVGVQQQQQQQRRQKYGA